MLRRLVVSGTQSLCIDHIHVIHLIFNLLVILPRLVAIVILLVVLPHLVALVITLFAALSNVLVICPAVVDFLRVVHIDTVEIVTLLIRICLLMFISEAYELALDQVSNND